MFAIAPTDLDWYRQLRVGPIPSLINFWTPTPWNIKGLNTGDRLYFLLKAPVRKVGGFGVFAFYQNMTVQEAWQRFGTGNGVQSLVELVERTGKYVDLRSLQSGIEANTMIGCIALSNSVFFDEQDFFAPEQRGVSFPRQVVKLKYFNGVDTASLDSSARPETLIADTLQPFQLVTKNQRSYRAGLVGQRPNQSRFREAVLAAYAQRCAVSGETTGEILEAAHIQPYMGPDSDHIQNGIALRVDLHRLFDAGLITFSENLELIVSDLIISPVYRQLQGTKLDIPQDRSLHPSLDALVIHREGVFRSSLN